MFTKAAQKKLMSWYSEHHRDLPWRKTRDSYKILVSEVMLQQTQVDRVIPKYNAFLGRFPTIDALADAPTSEVLRAWSGLGYNRRALNLQQACRTIVDEHSGKFPCQVDVLQTLPGIGPYTAGAIACFAFEQDVGFVDTNIKRVLHRVSEGPDFPEQRLNNREIAELAVELVPPRQGYIWNQSLIELGALICRSRQVDCISCPLQADCAARPDIELALADRVARKSNTVSPKFETTSRYFRGQIVRILLSENAGLTARELAERILPENEPQERILIHVDALLSDGLIFEVRYDGLIQQKGIGEEVPRPYDLDLLDRRYRLPD